MEGMVISTQALDGCESTIQIPGGASPWNRINRCSVVYRSIYETDFIYGFEMHVRRLQYYECLESHQAIL